VHDSLLEPGERAFLIALNDLGVRYLIVGVGAAVMQGAPLVTQDLDLWFEDRTDRRLHEAARRAGGVFVPGHFGMMPTQVGGGAIGERLDVVTTPDGLEGFAVEYGHAKTVDLDGIPVTVLPLERIIASKRAAGRAKDLAVLPALEATLAVERNAP
jgi:predicted nucleotidyltransferase